MANDFKNEKIELEQLIFLQFFLPKNYSRVEPTAYIFAISALFVILGFIWFSGFKVLLAIGMFVICIFAMYYYFWRNPLF